MIGIISHPGDDHAIAVMRVLIGRGETVQLIDTGQFPRNLSISLEFTGRYRRLMVSREGTEIDLEALRAVWWRRPQPYTLDEGIAPDTAQFAYSECHEAISGAWHALDCAWVNHPGADEIAHHKPYQLALAPRVGLEIPDTLVTSDPVAARAFIDRGNGEATIYKTFLAQESNWRETRLFGEAELAILDQVRLAPVIFQRFVGAQSDLRITVFGDEIHATEITSATDGYKFDYRTDLARTIMTATTLPADVSEAILRLMRALGLTYGAIDMRRTEQGRHVFLEVNPSGEFLFVEERTGQNLADAMARLLSRLAGTAIAPRAEFCERAA